MDNAEYFQIFKKECRNYLYYENRIKALDERITLLDLRMQNVHSPVLNKIGSSPSRHELNYELIIHQKDKLREEKAYYEEKMKWVRDTIDGIPSPAYRSLIWLTYVEREELQSIADDFGVSRQHIYKMRKKFLSIALSEERMQALANIETRYGHKGEQDERIKDGV